MIAALLLALAVDTTSVAQSVGFVCVAPATGNAGTCARPVPVLLPANPVTVHWRIYSLPIPAPRILEDSMTVMIGDTVRVRVSTSHPCQVIREVWTTRIGMSGGPVRLTGCSKRRLLTSYATRPAAMETRLPR